MRMFLVLLLSAMIPMHASVPIIVEIIAATSAMVNVFQIASIICSLANILAYQSVVNPVQTDMDLLLLKESTMSVPIGR